MADSDDVLARLTTDTAFADRLAEALANHNAPVKVTEPVKAGTFTYDTGNGTITVPLINDKSLKVGVFRKIRHLSEQDQAWTVLELVCSEDELALADDMNIDQFDDFMTRWQKASGVNVGESSASSTS